MKRILFLVLLLVSFTSCVHNQAASGVKRIIIDTDCGNGIDDFYAISRLLLDKNADVVAINAAHFNNSTQMALHIYGPDSQKPYDTAEESYQCIKQIVQACHREDVKVYHGANFLTGDPWGEVDAPSPSEASAAIIREVRSLPSGEKLYILCIGAATNVASAILEAPEIASSLSIWMMGGNYSLQTGYLDKGEFNTRNDLNAFDVLLKTEGLELHLMDAFVSGKLEFDLDVCAKRFKDNPNELGTLLANRWNQLQYDQLVLWDLATAEAFLNQEVAKETTIKAYTKDSARDIRLFTWIDTEKIENTYWEHFNSLK